MRGRAGSVLALAFVFLVLLFLTVGLEILAVPITLVFGWWPSMLRLCSRVHLAAGRMALLSIAIFALVAGSHFFLRWIYAELGNSAGSSPRRWRVKWTLCGFGILLCTLAAIGSAILTTHQLFWLSRSSDPLLAETVRERIRVLQLADHLQEFAEENSWEPEKVREAFLNDRELRAGQSPMEILQPVWVRKDSQSLEAIVLIPRRPLFRSSARIVVLQSGAKPAYHEMDELSEVLARFGLRQTN